MMSAIRPLKSIDSYFSKYYVIYSHNARFSKFCFSFHEKLNFNNCQLYSRVSAKREFFSLSPKHFKEKSLMDKKPTIQEEKKSQRARLKLAVRDYGATIIVFHVAISLVSLGLSYLAISNGIDPAKFLHYFDFSQSIISSKLALGGSTIVMAYALHKVFAPVRIAMTLTIAPLIVRHLRKINWLKPPASK